MPCNVVDLPEGGKAIVCTRRANFKHCSVTGCSGWQERLCDFPVSGTKTCDAALCRQHATRVGPNRDFCPQHYEQRMKELKKGG